MYSITRSLICALFLLPLISGITYAADAPDVEVPESDSYTWDGIYVGFSMSVDNDAHNEYWLNNVFNNGPHSFDDVDNLTSFSIGFNKQINGILQNNVLLYGAELSYMPEIIRDTGLSAYKNPLDIKLRLGNVGNVFSKDFLVYGVAGVSTASFKENYTTEYELANGFSSGFGAEYKLTQNVFIGAEYLTRNLDTTLHYPETSGFEINNSKLETLSFRIGYNLNSFE